MRASFIIGLVILTAAIMAIAGMADAQGSRCVILEKDGPRALISCNGSPAKYYDLRGKSDIYNVGDLVDVPDSSAEVPDARHQKRK
ncbi:MAG: hypothetical protein ACYDHW_03780 [Syntrophorhabdaceae bacterium]